MISLAHACLGAFLLLLSWHLGLSMSLPVVAWLGSALTLLGASRLITVERPTWGLLLVLFGTGAIAGSQLLEDWAIADSWPRDNGVGAGLLIALLLYLLWAYAARDPRAPDRVIERSSKTVLVWGLLGLLLISPADSVILNLGEAQLPLTTALGLILACLVLLADRCGDRLLARMALMLPALLFLPLGWLALERSQGPIVSALGDLFPRSREFSPTGFSPYQTLRASAFLRPSNDPVLRVRSEAPPSNYLVGNRLVSLDQDLVWLPSEQPLRSFSSLDAELLPSQEWRYPVANHHYSPADRPPRQMVLHSLSGDDYLFVTPGTTAVTGRFSSISRNAADVWSPDFDRGAETRWQLLSGGSGEPDVVRPETLHLPLFWDDELQAHSETFAGASRQQTADNLSDYFLGRNYTLETNFDPARPFHDFFLNDRAAYCFWFASATTLALRANGIPSRIVGGYLMHEQVSEDLWVVRERDAHSWVEWQDQAGYWHMIDPTPASMENFFGGYESSTMNHWYHRLAGQWQLLVDRIVENRLLATLITWGGLLVLVILFAREYGRLRQHRSGQDGLTLRWQRLWERFLRVTGLPHQSSWTAEAYAGQLPEHWRPGWRESVRDFLQNYDRARFSNQSQQALEEMEAALTRIARDKRKFA